MYLVDTNIFLEALLRQERTNDSNPTHNPLFPIFTRFVEDMIVDGIPPEDLKFQFRLQFHNNERSLLVSA